jgi:hypothetical protein
VVASSAVRLRDLTLGPNPLRSGDPLAVSWAGGAGGVTQVMELYDIQGRKIATLVLRRSGERWLGRLSADETRRWSSGVYFARLRGTPSGAERLVVIH